MNHPPYQKRALLLIITIIIIITGCLLWIVLYPSGVIRKNTAEADAIEQEAIADIYQNGKRIKSIPLSSVEEAYTFAVEGENGVLNEIEVRQGSIGISSASCPDKLCVHQGFISNSLLPITCLPNRLVIQIRRENSNAADTTEEITPDIITY